ncbi:MAG: ABC transporter substrate-binding protein, partial [Gemmatimonadales bacterium]
MRRTKLGRLVGSLALLAIVGSTSGASQVAAEERVTFRMNWYWRGVQAPFALARERGYFTREGVGVELLEGRGSAITAQLVGNRSDTFGFADGFTVMAAATKGVPVRAVATLLNGLSYAVVSLEEKGIRTAEDLEGRILGLTPGDGHTQPWPAVVAANRLDASKMRLVHMDPKAKGPALTERRVDAICCGSGRTLRRQIHVSPPLPSALAALAALVAPAGFGPVPCFS